MGGGHHSTERQVHLGCCHSRLECSRGLDLNYIPSVLHYRLCRRHRSRSRDFLPHQWNSSLFWTSNHCDHPKPSHATTGSRILPTAALRIPTSTAQYPPYGPPPQTQQAYLQQPPTAPPAGY